MLDSSCPGRKYSVWVKSTKLFPLFPLPVSRSTYCWDMWSGISREVEIAGIGAVGTWWSGLAREMVFFTTLWVYRYAFYIEIIGASQH